MICIDCDKEAKYIRHTQFAGSHPFCEEHAREQKGFLCNDSYESWEILAPSSNAD